MSDQYYQSHWQQIEAERLERYEQMFIWRPEQEALIAPLGLTAGMKVIDYGAGPGFLAAEMAKRVGDKGQVTGLDLNAEFVARANSRAVETGQTNLEFIQVQDAVSPLPDHSADGLICKNVLEYVPDINANIQEFRRLLRPGGRVVVVDSDWGFLLVEPWSQEETTQFFQSASGAFNEPHIGRKVPGLLQQAGFKDIKVDISAIADRKGHGRRVITNMGGYIRTLDTQSDAWVQDKLGRLDEAVAAGTFMFVLPQFIVSATAP